MSSQPATVSTIPHPRVDARFRPSCTIEDFTPSPDALPANLDSLANWTTAELNAQRHQRKTPTAQELQCQAPTNEDILTAETVIVLVSECSLRPKVTGVITLQQFGEDCRALLRLSDGREQAVKHYMWLIIFMSANVLVQEKLFWPQDMDQVLLFLFREHRYWKRSSDMTQANAGRCRLSSGHYARALSTLASIIGDSAFGIPIKSKTSFLDLIHLLMVTDPKLLYQFKQWVYLAPNDDRRLNQYAFAALRPAKPVHAFLGGMNSPIE